MEDVILDVFDCNKKKIDVTINIDFIKHKYSNIKNETARVYINDEIVKKENNYYITYKCNQCGKKSDVVTLNNIIRRIRNNSKHCYKCKETNIEKKSKHSQLMILKNNGTYVERKNIIKPTIACPPDYYYYHLTLQEFSVIREFIITINSISIYNLKYEPEYLINRITYFPRFIDNLGNIIKPENIIYKCKKCNKISKSPILSSKTRKKECICMCRYCYLVSKKFVVKQTKNINNVLLTYQSKPEYNFVVFCNKNNIEVVNGPILEYFWNKKRRTYSVDFLIPNNFLIEIKGDHIWHRKQVECGKWNEKEKIAKQYCLENNIEFMLVFYKDFHKAFNEILLRYSPTSKET